jgi:hypothetical protein
MLIYFWKVGRVLDIPAGKVTMGDYLTHDQLEMLLTLLPKE